MQYSIPVTVQPSHTITNPIYVSAHFGAGILRKVDLFFPPGPAGLVRISIFHENRQILPTNPDGSYYGDNIHISTQCYINLTDDDNVLVIKGYNDSCSFPHTVLLLFEVRDPNEPDLIDVMKSQINLLGKLVDIYKSAFW